MKKTILSLATAVAVGLAGLTAAPQPAHAFWWVIPAIVGAGVVGVGAGAAIDNSAHRTYAYEPRGEVYVAPSGCHFESQHIGGHWRRVEVCG